MGKVVQVSSKVSVEDAAELFKKSMRVTWLSEVSGRGTKFEKPRQDEAFGDLDKDKPIFEVMAILGGSGEDINRSAVFLFAWDRGSHREFRLGQGNALLATGIKGKLKINKFVVALRQLDPHLQAAGL
jgi:hypothetical protein